MQWSVQWPNDITILNRAGVLIYDIPAGTNISIFSHQWARNASKDYFFSQRLKHILQVYTRNCLKSASRLFSCGIGAVSSRSVTKQCIYITVICQRLSTNNLHLLQTFSKRQSRKKSFVLTDDLTDF